MNRPKLTIGILTYNRAELLRLSLASALASPADTEILVADNASTDETPAVLQAFAEQDSRIRVIRRPENVGMLANFNLLMEEVRGEYMTLLCDDDLILPGNFERKIPILDAHPEIGFVYSPWHMIDLQGRSQGCPTGSGQVSYGYIGGRDEFTDLLQNNHIMMNAVVFRMSLYEQYGAAEDDPRVNPSNDWDMWLRYSQHTQTAYVPEPLVAVRYHSGAESQRIYSNGALARARVGIWRKFLVDADEPPVLNENVWQRMRTLFETDLTYWFSGDRGRVEPFLSELEQIKRLNHAKANARVTALLAGVKAEADAKGPQRSAVQDAASQARSSGGLSPLIPTISWTAPLLDSSGYADEARNFALALDAAGWDVRARIIPTPRRAELPARISARLARMSSRPPVPGTPHVSHVTSPELSRLDGASVNIGRTMFETDRLPEGWAGACARMDRIWVPSEFNRETFARAGVPERKIAVMPGAIDLAGYDLETPPLEIEGARGFNFLSVFDWTLRKGWDVLLRAYIEEFEPGEDVALIIKTSSYPERGYTIEKIAQVAGSYISDVLGRDPDRIPDLILQDRAIPAARMPALYRAADCFVLPTRGEGWGRPFMEAMAMALPTIGTGWSGNTAFMSAQNSLLLDFTLVDIPEPAWRECPMLRGHRWAEPDAGHLRRLMRAVFESRDRSVGERAREDLRTNFSYAAIAERIREELATIAVPKAA
jgi:glycosyltransferase involved in cell wall biosynthesis